MILRSLLSFFICVIAYTALVKIIDMKDFEPINQNQGNTVATEEFLLDKAYTCSHFIVGSSLSYRIKNSMLPDNIWNLSVAGGSFFRGLEMIKATEVKPEFILIETNVLERRPSTDPLTNEDVKNVDFYLKKNVEVAQKKNQPVSYAINLLYKALKTKSTPSKVSQKSYDKAVKMQEEAFQKDLTLEPKIATHVSKLKEYIDYFESMGVCVVLYEMPISCTLTSLPKSLTNRQLLEEQLPRAKYNYLPYYDCEQVSTTDGIHIEEESAKQVKDYLLSQLSTLNCN